MEALSLTVPEEQEICRAWLPEVSRTFALSIEMLPEGLRDPVRVAYLLCRLVDTIEDDATLSTTDREALFDAFDRAMADDAADVRPLERLVRSSGLTGSAAELDMANRASILFTAFRDLPAIQRDRVRPHVLEMSLGMREYARRAADAGQLRITNVEDLERYCYFVAGTVGNLLTDLFLDQVRDLPAQARERVRANAVHFGLGLQLVNILKDVADDHTRGVCFLPESLATRRGITLERVLDPAARKEALGVVSELCDRARDHLVRAVSYTAWWPAHEGSPVRLFCAVPLALAFETLREVESGEDTLVPGRCPKVTRDTVTAVVVRAELAARDDRAFQRMFWPYVAFA